MMPITHAMQIAQTKASGKRGDKEGRGVAGVQKWKSLPREEVRQAFR
jgi:hypothetical protein